MTTPNPLNPYSLMQRKVYDIDAAKWTPEDRDWVVGSWDAHNAWPDYDLLFKELETEGKLALDFGCGPGRCLVKYAPLFKAVDGADISPVNLDKAADYTRSNGLDCVKLYHCNGVDIRGVMSEFYDVVFSVICLQHIPVWNIRYNLFKEFARVLKTGGWFTAQMGFGDNGDLRGVDYWDNRYDTEVTNGGCDVKVCDPLSLRDDLRQAGFSNFQYQITGTGPGDWHPNWIFFRAQKDKG